MAEAGFSRPTMVHSSWNPDLDAGSDLAKFVEKMNTRDWRAWVALPETDAFLAEMAAKPYCQTNRPVQRLGDAAPELTPLRRLTVAVVDDARNNLLSGRTEEAIRSLRRLDRIACHVASVPTVDRVHAALLVRIQVLGLMEEPAVVQAAGVELAKFAQSLPPQARFDGLCEREVEAEVALLQERRGLVIPKAETQAVLDKWKSCLASLHSAGVSVLDQARALNANRSAPVSVRSMAGAFLEAESRRESLVRRLQA